MLVNITCGPRAPLPPTPVKSNLIPPRASAEFPGSLVNSDARIRFLSRPPVTLQRSSLIIP